MTEKTEASRASYHDIYDDLRPYGFYGAICLLCTKYPPATEVFTITEDRRLSDPDIAMNFAFFSSGREHIFCTRRGITRQCIPLKNDRLPGELRRAVR